MIRHAVEAERGQRNDVAVGYTIWLVTLRAYMTSDPILWMSTCRMWHAVLNASRDVEAWQAVPLEIKRSIDPKRFAEELNAA